MGSSTTANKSSNVGEKLWTILPAAAILQKFLNTFDEFPMRQTPLGFNPKGVMEKVLQAAADRQGN
jgi:arylsulfatase